LQLKMDESRQLPDPVIQLVELELITPNPGPYKESFRWRMRISASEQLTEPMSISFVWVGSSGSSAYDQMLDSFDVGPFVPGITEFNLECDPPEVSRIPPQDVLGVTVLLISFQYRGQEFLRVGYYTQVAYFDDALNACPPEVADASLLGRFLAMSQPAVTILPVPWDRVLDDPNAYLE
jgi:histone chaperone ASF1